MYTKKINGPMWSHVNENGKKEAQGLGALLHKMEENDHIKLDNIEI